MAGQDEQLARLYQANKRSTAYLDESFHLDGLTGKTFFILACVTIKPGQRTPTRNALHQAFSGETIHAAPMWKNNQQDSLDQAARIAASENDGLDVVVVAPLANDDPQADRARLQCIRFLAPQLHQQDDVDLFVFDKPASPGIATRDTHAFRDLIKEGSLSRSVSIHHAYPNQEPLLGLPDILAWSYRQTLTRNNRRWFAHFEQKDGLLIHTLNPTD